MSDAKISCDENDQTDEQEVRQNLANNSAASDDDSRSAVASNADESQPNVASDVGVESQPVGAPDADDLQSVGASDADDSQPNVAPDVSDLSAADGGEEDADETNEFKHIPQQQGLISANDEYGYNEKDGCYYSPHAVSVVYHEDDPFESLVVALLDQPQSIPLTEESDANLSAEVFKYISIEVLIFGDSLSREGVLKFFDRGFQRVRIMSNTAKYVEDGKPFDERVIIFWLADALENICLMRGMTAVYIFEYLARAKYGDRYLSHCQIALDDATCFVKYLKNIGFAKSRALLTKICNNIMGMDEVDKLVLSAKAEETEKKRTATRRLHKTPMTKIGDRDVLFIPGYEYSEEVSELAPLLTSADFVVLFAGFNNYELCALSLKPGNADAFGLLNDMKCTDCHGDGAMAIGKLAATDISIMTANLSVPYQKLRFATKPKSADHTVGFDMSDIRPENLDESADTARQTENVQNASADTQREQNADEDAAKSVDLFEDC